jgi:YD repeat-containing protein
MEAKPHPAHEDNHRRRVHRLETHTEVSPTCHSKGILPALRKQPAEKYLSRFFADRLDRVIEYDYDALQRRTAEHWLAANQQILRTIEYAYDGLSRLTGVEDPDSSYATTPIRC